MKVQNNPAHDAARSSEASKTREGKDGKETSRTAASKNVGDSAKTEISSRAREMSLAKKIAMEAPDAREERIAELKRRIAAGEYNRKPEDIADRLVDNHLETMGMS